MLNTEFHDIFIYNPTSGEAHSATRLTYSCNLNKNKMANWWVIPFDSEEMLHSYIKNMANSEFPMSLCPHCFPDINIT